MTTPHPIQRRLILLGSTGSIGINTLEVIEHLRRAGAAHFEVVGLAAGSNAALLSKQAAHFKAAGVALADRSQEHALHGVARRWTGPDAALEMVQAVARRGDLVVGAMVGSAGIPATLAAIARGCDVALANKETLVAAGQLVMPAVAAAGVRLLPIDSEHSAIFQCLLGGRSVHEVKRLVITASGGPFRTWAIDRMDRATAKEALNHPTWRMGPKVTIDSASMMNKALEIIEAHWLFGLPSERIGVVIHPQSVVHSFVEFVDNSIMAQLGPPDMKTPIQYALTWPFRAPGTSKAMDWASLRNLDFEALDETRFAAPSLAHRVINQGGTTGAVMNAANEAAVAAFLEGRIGFGRIVRLAQEAVEACGCQPVHTIDDVFRADAEAREWVAGRIGSATAAQSADSQHGLAASAISA